MTECVCKILKESGDISNSNKIVREIAILETCDDIEGVVNLLGSRRTRLSSQNMALVKVLGISISGYPTRGALL